MSKEKMATTDNVPGFDDLQGSDDNEILDVSKKKKSKKSGGFQGMGLSFPILKGITKKGYKVPTPIQRKSIPLVLEGRDVVAMARTGSGKTACFLIPLFEKLKLRTAMAGARALILSPTRELALQTLKFIKEIGRFTGLKAAVILGGDSMDDQFNAIHGNPDIIVATPGRFLHICVEMELKLNSIEYIVFDEADRLFEMGFGEQLNEIINRLPESRQTLLFSATLPKILVEFAKVGLSDPVLIRLDVESKLPDELTLSFLTCRLEEKLAALLVLLKNVIPQKSPTVVFAATKHHVEYIHMILQKAGIESAYIYSDLDPTARKINAAKFSSKKVSVLIVTDVAARGIDIPQLDNVINYNFPSKAKLFVHRVGRCARAGRTGTAYSIISPDEYAHLLDLHLFLGRPLKLIPPSGLSASENVNVGAIGTIPQALLEEQQSLLFSWHDMYTDLVSMQKVCENGYKRYMSSRPLASADSNKRIKDLQVSSAGIHPLFGTVDNELEKKRYLLLHQMKQYQSKGTVFEMGTKNSEYTIMKATREFHKNNILSHQQRLEKLNESCKIETNEQENKILADSNTEDISSAFKSIVVPKRKNMDNLYKPKVKKQKVIKDEEHYVPYTAPDKFTEEGLSVNNFTREADKMQLDLTADSEDAQRLQKQMKRWDRKKKKMVAVNQDSKSKKIRTESGIWIPATYKSDRYAQWRERTKADAEEEAEASEDDKPKSRIDRQMSHKHWARHNKKLEEKKRRSELKHPEQILKARKIAEEKKRRQQKKRGHRGAGSHKPKGKVSKKR